MTTYLWEGENEEVLEEKEEEEKRKEEDEEKERGIMGTRVVDEKKAHAYTVFNKRRHAREMMSGHGFCNVSIR